MVVVVEGTFTYIYIYIYMCGRRNLKDIYVGRGTLFGCCQGDSGWMDNPSGTVGLLKTKA
jgi:hypothetical protein